MSALERADRCPPGAYNAHIPNVDDLPRDALASQEDDERQIRQHDDDNTESSLDGSAEVSVYGIVPRACTNIGPLPVPAAIPISISASYALPPSPFPHPQPQLSPYTRRRTPDTRARKKVTCIGTRELASPSVLSRSSSHTSSKLDSYRRHTASTTPFAEATILLRLLLLLLLLPLPRVQGSERMLPIHKPRCRLDLPKQVFLAALRSAICPYFPVQVPAHTLCNSKAFLMSQTYIHSSILVQYTCTIRNTLPRIPSAFLSTFPSAPSYITRLLRI